MKTIVTHVRPHLDEVAAIWLLKRFLPEEYRDAKIEYVAANERDSSDGAAADRISVGVGSGEFDEHKGDVGECAASLILKHLRQSGVKSDALETRGLDKLIDWVKLDDTGQLHKIPHHSFSLHAILAFHRQLTGSDEALMSLGLTVCDALFAAQKNEAVLEDDWKTHIEFESIYGPAAAVSTSARDIEAFAFQRGFDLIVYVNKERNYHNIRAFAGSRIDLTPVYQQIMQVEPEANWYLHHSKKMIICGGDLTKNVRTSKLTLEWIADLLTPNYVRQQRY
ncbi:MAG: chromate resistance protein ChrB domain-containing protein [Patescibacteria group bacterium]|jgi:hypothetical protein